MKLRRKSPTAEALQWDGNQTTLDRLAGAGMKVHRTTGHVDRPGDVDQLTIAMNVAESALTAPTVVDVGQWIVREEDGSFRGRWYVFKTPEDLLAVYEVAP